MAKEEWLITPGDRRTIDLDSVEKLKVALIRGHVDVIGHDEPGARVEIDGVTGKDLRVSFEDGRLVVDHPQLAWDNFLQVFGAFRGKASAEVSILVPHRVALNLGVVSAEGLVSGIHRDASVSTVSGSLLVDQGIGELQLNAVSGEITVRGHRGTVQAHTVSGEITLNGEIPKVTIDTVSGDLFADLHGAVQRIRSNSVAGDVTLRLPHAAPIDYVINTVTGRLQLDASEFRGVKGGFSGRWTPDVAAGVDTVEVRANSVSGNVVVLHGPAETSTATDAPSAPTAHAAAPATPPVAEPSAEASA